MSATFPTASHWAWNGKKRFTHVLMLLKCKDQVAQRKIFVHKNNSQYQKKKSLNMQRSATEFSQIGQQHSRICEWVPGGFHAHQWQLEGHMLLSPFQGSDKDKFVQEYNIKKVFHVERYIQITKTDIKPDVRKVSKWDCLVKKLKVWLTLTISPGNLA